MASKKRKINEIDDKMEPHQNNLHASKKRKLIQSSDYVPWQKCSECNKYWKAYNFINNVKNEGICVDCCHSEKFKDDKNIWKSITLQSKISDVLQQCNLRHRHHLDKLKGGEFCNACSNWINERNKYWNAIAKNQTLKPMKRTLLSYLMHTKSDYYTKIGFPKYQLILDDWHTYALNQNNLLKSVNIFKKIMSKLNINAFMDLLVKLQPWMSVDNLLSIIEYQLPHHNNYKNEKVVLDKYEIRNRLFKRIVNSHYSCNGCSQLSIAATSQQCWICHMAMKTMLLMYFCVNFGSVDLADCFNNLCSYIRHHSYSNCNWLWEIPIDHRYIHFFGRHAVKGHIINEMKDKNEDEHLFTPPIITKEIMNTVQYNMLNGIRGERAQNVPSVVWIANEMGSIDQHTL